MVLYINLADTQGGDNGYLELQRKLSVREDKEVTYGKLNQKAAMGCIKFLELLTLLDQLSDGVKSL